MKHIHTYIFFTLSFLTSFCFSEGFLNENSYIKQSAVGVVVLVQGLIALWVNNSFKVQVFRFSLIDILIIALSLIYLQFFINTRNGIDFSIPFIYICYYFFLRILLQNDVLTVEIAICKIVPYIIWAHYLIALLQFLNSNVHRRK